MKAFEWTNPASVNEAVKMLTVSVRLVILMRRHDRSPVDRIC